MIFLIADEKTYKDLQGYCNDNGRFEFRPLPDGRNVIHEEILQSEDFPELVPQLSKLPKETYNEQDN